MQKPGVFHPPIHPCFQWAYTTGVLLYGLLSVWTIYSSDYVTLLSAPTANARPSPRSTSIPSKSGKKVRSKRPDDLDAVRVKCLSLIHLDKYEKVRLVQHTSFGTWYIA